MQLRSLVNVSHNDSWMNAVTGMGTSIDRASRATFQRSVILNDYTLRNLFVDDDLSRKIVLKRPKEMMRKGFTLTSDDRADDERIDLAMAEARRLGVRAKVYEVLWKERLYGGAALFKVTDTDDDEGPMLEGENLLNLVVIDRRFLTVHEWQNDIAVVSPAFNTPLIYRLTNPATFSSTAKIKEVPTLIHATRIIRFSGAEIDDDTRRERSGWGVSVLQEAYEVLKQHGQAWQGLAHGMTEWSQGVFKLKGLIQMIAAGKDKAIQKRMAVVNMSRGVGRAVVIDADTEEFTRLELSFSGVGIVMDKFMMRVSSVAEIPVSLLFGRSPAGMNATGESDIRQFYDGIDSDRTNKLEPGLRDIFQTIFDHTDIEEPSQWALKFPKLWEPTEKEQAEIDKLNSDKYVNEINAEILLPEEVALSIYDENSVIQIDRESREKSLEALLKEVSKPDDTDDDKDDDTDTKPDDTKPDDTKPDETSDQETENKIEEKKAFNAGDRTSFVTMNEARAEDGKGPMLDVNGKADPDGRLTVNVYEAKHIKIQTLLAEAEVKKELGVTDEPNQSDPDNSQPPAQGAPPKQAPENAPPPGRSEGGPEPKEGTQDPPNDEDE